MATFATTFGELVTPDLRRMCRSEGLFVALEMKEFQDAYATVWGEARRRGALMLPMSIIDQLQDWILNQILQAEAEARPDVEARREIVDRVALDIARTEAKWREIWAGQ